MSRSRGLRCKNFLFPCLLLTTLMLPSSAFVTSAAQQGDFKVSVAGTSNGSIPQKNALKVIQIPEGQLNEAISFVIEPESLVQEKRGENFVVSTRENMKVKTVILRDVQVQQVSLLPLPKNLWLLQSLVQDIYLLDVLADMSSSGIMGAHETVLMILAPNQHPLPPVQSINQIPTRIETDIRLIFQNDTETLSPIPEPPLSPCYFDPTLEECQPVNGRCPSESVFNENEQCIPIGKCPDGYGRLDDDETGKCYKNSDIKTCPDGYITHKNADCPPDELPTSSFFGKKDFSV